MLSCLIVAVTTLLTLKLESEYNLAPQSFCFQISNFVFQVIVFNLTYDIFSKSIVSEYTITFKAQHIVCKTVHGMISISSSTLIVVFCN